MSNQLKTRFLAMMMAGLSLAGMSGCEDRDAPVPHEADVYSRMSIKLDPALSFKEKSLLIEDLYNSMQFQLKAAKNSYFDKAFGGTETTNVVDYLDERLNYLLPEKVKLDSRIGLLNPSISESLGIPTNLTEKEKIYTVAVNIGTGLWFGAVASLPQKLYFRIGDAKVPIDSSRVGIMQLGQGYTLKGKDGKYVFPTIIRVTTLVHEARHSDCTGGLNASDLELLKNGKLPVSHACGHTHVVCPKGHPYEGAFACDAEAWGAYSIESLYALGLMKACKNCSETDKKVAEASAVDSLSRVLVLDDMMNGKLGDPDMSSSSKVNPDAVKLQVLQFRKQRKADPGATEATIE